MGQYIIQFIGTAIIPLALFYWRTKVDRNNEEKRLKVETEKRETERDVKDERMATTFKQYIREQISELSSKLTDVEMLLKSHIEDSDFRMQFKNKIGNTTLDLLKASDLDLQFKNIVWYWFSRIEIFSLDFYYSSHRKNDTKKLETNLEETFEIILNEFCRHIDLTIKDTRMFNGNKVIFSKFLEESHFFNKSRVLINILSNNGLDELSFTKLIVNYINTFHSDFLTVLRIWRSLKRFSFNDEEIAA